MTEIRSLEAEPLNLPLVEPFTISLGTQSEASNILVTVETASGVTGTGEATPLPPVTGETQGGALDCVRSAREIVVGRHVENYRELVRTLRQTYAWAPAALHALETAILDAFCRELDISLAEVFGGKPRPITTDLTIGIMPAEEAVTRAERAGASGFDHLKIKTGNDVAEDVDRVTAVADAVPGAHLKVDANQGWTPKETIWFADQVTDQGITLDLIEQPVPKSDLSGLAMTRHRVDIPIAADESVFTPADAIEVVTEGAADVINAKLGKSGLLGVADIAVIASAADLDLMIGCMLESAIGIHTSAHLVAGLGNFDYIDLDGNLALEQDVIPVDGGPVHDIAGPGHGVTPEIEGLDAS